MSDIHQLHVSGHLGADAILRETANGTPVLNFNLGSSERWTDEQGRDQQRTTWFRGVVFGPRARGLAKYLTKGSQVFVQGKLQPDEYEKDGKKVYGFKLLVEEINFGQLKNVPPRDAKAPAPETNAEDNF